MHIGLVYDQKTINNLSKEELNSPPPFILIAYDDQTPTNEAGYIALGHASREGVWMRRFLNEMALGETTVVLNGDNESSLSSTKNPEAQSRTKHIDVQHHYLRELINAKELIVAWVPSARMLADGFTKALTIDAFKRHRSLLGLN